MAMRFFCAVLPNPIVVNGHTIYWSSYWHAAEFASGSYEPDTILLFKSLIRPGMTIVDIGAHIGFYSLLSARLVGSEGKVYAFEPEPSNYALLLKNITANRYENVVIAINKAVTNKPGPVSFFLGVRSDVHSLFHKPWSSSQTITVEGTTLDDFFQSEGWPPVDLIKMDIEGAEKAALETMKQLVGKNQSLKLIIEFSPGNQATAGVSNEEFFDTLVKLGFRKFLVLRAGQQSVNIPDDIPRLVQMAEMAGDSYVNLFCER